VHHLADSETVSGIRLRRLLAEDHPVIQGYDQDEYATRLKYNERDTAPALEAFHAARASAAQVIEQMSDEIGSVKAATPRADAIQLRTG